MSEKFLNRSAFAAQQGWSPSYVTKLGYQGRLVLCPDNPKLVDVEATLATLLSTGDPRKENVRQHHAADRVEKHVTAHIQPDAPSNDEPAATADPKYWDAKARREHTLGELAELELAKKRGEQVDRSRVEAMSFAAGRMTRDAVLGLTPRLAAEFAAMTDAFEIEIKLRDALKQVFANVATMTADDLNKAMEQ